MSWMCPDKYSSKWMLNYNKWVIKGFCPEDIGSFMKETSVFLAFVVSLFSYTTNCLSFACTVSFAPSVPCYSLSPLFAHLFCGYLLADTQSSYLLQGRLPSLPRSTSLSFPWALFRHCISFSHHHIILKVSLYLTPLLYCKLLEGRHHCHFQLCFVFFSPVLKIVTINI